MIIAIAYFCVMVALLLFIIRGNRGLGLPGLAAFGVYVISSAAMLVLVFLEKTPLRLWPTLYFLILLLLFMLPHVSRRKIEQQANRPVTWSGLHTVYSFAIMLPCFYSILYSLPVAFRNLRGGLEMGRSLVYSGQGIGTGNLYATLCSGFWPVALVLTVYAVLARRSVAFISCLAVASGAGAVNGLASLGRSGLVYWALFVIILLSLTWPMLKVRLGRNVIYLQAAMAVIVILVSVFIVALAYGRNLGASAKFTGLNTRLGQSFYSLTRYTGQSLINFQDFWDLHEDFGRNLHGQRIFPIYYGMLERLGLVNDYNAAEINIIYKPVYDALNLEHAVFNGFQRELIMDFGKRGALLVGLLYAIVAWVARRRYEHTFAFSSIMFSSFLISIPVLGVFFFSYGELWANISMIVILVTCLLFSVAEMGGFLGTKPVVHAPGRLGRSKA